MTKALLSLGWAVVFCLMGVFHVWMGAVFFSLGVAFAWAFAATGKELK